jgi:hypothetical protein
MAKTTVETTEPDKLFDTTDPAHVEIFAVCKALYGIRRLRMSAGRDEHDQQDKLLALMHKHGLDEFDLDGVHAEIVEKREKVKVLIAGGGDDEGDGDEES